MTMPELIISGCSRRYAELATLLGYGYGHSSDAGQPRREPVDFLDSEDYRHVNLRKHLQAAIRLRPRYVVLPDVYQASDVARTLKVAASFARYCQYVIVVPKADGVMSALPYDQQIVIGLSVPSSHGGYFDFPTLYAGRLVHLLGGGPETQRNNLRGQINWARQLWAVGATLLSTDSNYAAKVARYGMIFRAGSGSQRSGWLPARELGSEVTADVPYIAFERSLINIRQAWQRALVALRREDEV